MSDLPPLNGTASRETIWGWSKPREATNATRKDGTGCRSDNGSEFTAKCVREWLGRVGVKTLFIEPGSPWENGYVESFNGKLRDELLAREAFDTLLEAKVLIERWRQHYNTIRPHSALGYRPPAPETLQPCVVATAAPPQPHRAGLLEGKT